MPALEPQYLAILKQVLAARFVPFLPPLLGNVNPADHAAKQAFLLRLTAAAKTAQLHAAQATRVKIKKVCIFLALAEVPHFFDAGVFKLVRFGMFMENHRRIAKLHS